MIQRFAPAVIFITLIFAFQSFDIPPLRGAANPKTCCGRSICLCKHAKGVPCPLRLQGAQAHPKNCHLEKDFSGVDSSARVKNSNPETLWTKAPCHRDTPKYAASNVWKDFIPAEFFVLSPLRRHDRIAKSSRPPRGLLADLGIDRPPKLILPAHL